jgi:hypothetical protein
MQQQLIVVSGDDNESQQLSVRRKDGWLRWDVEGTLEARNVAATRGLIEALHAHHAIQCGT